MGTWRRRAAIANLVFTPEQRAVIDSDLPTFTVTASAGAGKTSVLTARYLRHVVEDGLTPDQILTITYTNRAAAEMKRRIVDQLLGAGRPGDAQVAESGPIQTVHSFCGRLLRENALEAGIDPRFEILSGGAVRRVKATAIRSALSHDYAEKPDIESLIRRSTGQSARYGGAAAPYSGLEDAIDKLINEFRAADVTRAKIRETYASPDRLQAHWESLVIGRMPDEVREKWESLVTGTFQEQVVLAYKAARVKVPKWVKKSDEVKEEAARRDACALVWLACDAWEKFDQHCRQQQTFDFAAIERGALELLRTSPAAVERLRRQFRVMMVDEAQDINPVQYALFDALGIRQSMFVGDLKQSIYGFRYADVRLFQERMATARLELKKNHRAEQQGILRFVDRIFSRLWGDEYPPMTAEVEFDLEEDAQEDFQGVEIWHAEPGIKDVIEGIQGLISEGVRPHEIGVLVRRMKNAEALREGLNSVGIPARVTGAAETFYTRLEVRDLANALRAVSDPYDDFSLLATLRSPFGDLSLDTVVLLAKQSPVAESLPAFESPLEADNAKLDVFRDWFFALSKYADRLAAWEVIAELFAKTPYLDLLGRLPKGERQIANARKLLRLASKDPLVGPMEYAEQMRETLLLQHREGDAPFGGEEDRVTLTTIHSAKGLEYPVVVLAETDTGIRPSSGPVAVDPVDRLVGVNFSKYEDAIFRDVKSSRDERNREEEERLLYVALTRARKRLCVVLYPKKNKKTFTDVIQDTGNLRSLPGAVVRGEKETSASPRVAALAE